MSSLEFGVLPSAPVYCYLLVCIIQFYMYETDNTDLQIWFILSLKIVAFETAPFSLGISINPPGSGYGYFLEPDSGQ